MLVLQLQMILRQESLQQSLIFGVSMLGTDALAAALDEDEEEDGNGAGDVDDSDDDDNIERTMI